MSNLQRLTLSVESMNIYSKVESFKIETNTKCTKTDLNFHSYVVSAQIDSNVESAKMDLKLCTKNIMKIKCILA